MSDNDKIRQLALEAFQNADYETALNRSAEVLAASENDAMMWQLQGLSAMQLGNFEQGASSLEKTLSLSGADAEVLNNLGIARRRLGDLEGAVTAYTTSIGLCGDIAATHNNLADARVAQNKWEDAIASFRTALLLNPQDVSTRFNLANLLRDMGNHEQSCSQYENLMSQFPDDVEIQWNAALAYLARGDWRTGFRLYESRFRLKNMDTPPVPEGMARWNGEPLDAKRILIISEQGFGDLFQMLACASRFKQRGASVVVQCHSRLHKLILASEVVDAVVDESANNVRADFYEWLMSCPGKLHLEADDVPATKSWLSLPEIPDGKWKELLPQDDRLKVGIHFQGSPDFPHDQFRSLALSHFKPLWERDDVALVSIQKGHGVEQLEGLSDSEVIALGDTLDTGEHAFADTARCIHELDVLITSDTAVAHLAGAMGCRVWVVLSTVVDWRWGIKGEACSWYPSMRLFRQRVRGNWSSVISDLAGALDQISRG